jgi:PAS domain S-box-containing protein
MTGKKINLLPVSAWPRRSVLILVCTGLAAGLTFWYFAIRTPPIPRRTLRIGFEQVTPVQIRTADGFAGLAVEIINEAAERTGLSLQWVETGTSSEEAFRRGLVDLWPLMGDLPQRRKLVHITTPWLLATHTLVLRDGSASLVRKFDGRIAVFRLPVQVRLAHQEFPNAQLVESPEPEDVVNQVCEGKVSAGFLEGRVAVAILREKPAECASIGLRVQPLPDLTVKLGIASTFQSAGAADKLREEINNLVLDGTVSAAIAKYSFYSLDDMRNTYTLVQAAERARWLAWGVGVCSIGLLVTIWQATSLRYRTRSEAALRASEERFRNMADTAPVMIWISGPDKLCSFFNQGWLTFTGSTMEEAIGNGWSSKVHPDDRDNCFSTFSSALGTLRTFQTECRLRRADGEYRWVVATGVPRFESGGAFTGYVGSCTDITDIKRIQEEALARQKLESVGLLANGIAHDFNNVLGGILSEAELAEMELEEGASPVESIHRIGAAATHGAEIVRELMIYSGQEEAAPRELLDFSRLLREMLRLLEISISKHAVLTVDSGANLPVLGRVSQLQQVVMNLVINASEAIGEKEGVITVIASRVKLPRTSDLTKLSFNSPPHIPSGDYVRLEVSDTGNGMTEEVQTKAFEAFFSTKFVGRGLGLAVAQRIVRDHGGAITFLSVPAQGTTFEVLLPYVVDTIQSRRGDAAQNGVQIPLLSGTILVVEDEKELRIAVSKMLRRNGLAVIEAMDGTAAIQLFHAHRDEIDIILLDLTLPGATSLEVFQEVRRVRPDAKVVFTSAYSRETGEATLAGLHIEHFIRKPFQLVDLMGMLQEALSA